MKKLDTTITLEEAREALGETGKGMSEAEIFDLVAKAQNLAHGWLDSYEKSIFKGKTLNQLLTSQEEGSYHE